MRTRAARSRRAFARSARSRNSPGTRSERGMGPTSLGHQFGGLGGDVPIRGEAALALVVIGEPADLRLGQMEAAAVVQVLRVRAEVDLEAHGALQERRA